MLKQAALGLIWSGLLFGVYRLAELPELDEFERSSLASQFAFQRLAMPELPGIWPDRQEYPVHPDLDAISGFVSAMGASVALTDFDGDGLPNDLCHVEPRRGHVLLAPVPGTGNRYSRQLLPEPDRYDAGNMTPMGCLPGDLNEDGRMDFVVYYAGRTPVVFINSETGFLPVEVISQTTSWYTTTGALADFNGDGHMDLVFGNFFQDGADTLDPNGVESGEMPNSFSRAVNGGKAHILLWTGQEEGVVPMPRYTKQTGILSKRVEHGWTLAIGAADLNGDMLPEIYLANDFGSDALLFNRSSIDKLRLIELKGEKDFTTPVSKLIGRDSFKGMGVDFADLNQDGYLDIFVSNVAADFTAQESHYAFLSSGDVARMDEGIAPYHDYSDEIGLARSDWGWGIKAADFNNDNKLEIIQATGFIKGKIDRWPDLLELAIGNDERIPDPRVWPSLQIGDDLSGHAVNPFFVQDRNGYFHDLAPSLGMGEPYLGRGIAIADVDGDGDLDFALANHWEDSYFFRNDCPDCGAYLGLRLLLPARGNPRQAFSVHRGRPPLPGYAAIGASVLLETADGIRQAAQVDGGNGHSGKNSPELHFGLGKKLAGSLLKVTIRWRDSDGNLHDRQLELKPGWYTLLLGENTNEV